MAVEICLASVYMLLAVYMIISIVINSSMYFFTDNPIYIQIVYLIVSILFFIFMPGFIQFIGGKFCGG